jgi:hypothetical protein
MGGLLTKIYGQPPEPGAPKIVRLRFVRRVAYFSTVVPFAVVLVVTGVTFSSPLNWVIPVVGGPVWLRGFVSITLQIRRERSKG